MEIENDCSRMSNDQLMRRLDELALQGRRNLRAFLRHLAEFDRRRGAILEGGAPSTFQYCVSRLGFSEDEAYKRIQVARAAAEWPIILDMLESGCLHLTAGTLLRPHLKEHNHARLLDEARGKSTFDVRRMVAALAPEPDGPDVIRRVNRDGEAAATSSRIQQTLPEPASTDHAFTPVVGGAQCQSTPPREQSLIPTAPERIRFSFTGSEKLLELLRRAQDLLRHKYPAGDLELVFLDVLDAFLDRRDPERRLKAKEERRKEYGHPAPRPPQDWDSRRVPQSVKDQVWRRDGGQCVYREPDGQRCPERGGLEFDHVVPFALGGPSNNAKNIRLLCKAHNRALAARTFGDFSAWRWRARRDTPGSSGLSAS
jgi:hypothetical protein